MWRRAALIRMGMHVVNALGRTIRFVPAPNAPAAEYEQRVYISGEVSTRANNWHDFFNAMVWLHFPRLKRTFNALHHVQIERGFISRRGPLRDALTLIDEWRKLNEIAQKRRR